MQIPKRLLDLLACPVCKTPVTLLPDDAGLKCQTCKRIYHLRDEILNLLPEEASIAPE